MDLAALMRGAGKDNYWQTYETFAQKYEAPLPDERTSLIDETSTVRTLIIFVLAGAEQKTTFTQTREQFHTLLDRLLKSIDAEKALPGAVRKLIRECLPVLGMLIALKLDIPVPAERRVKRLHGDIKGTRIVQCGLR